ncbi:hypothetical protein MLD38_032218 [Melastoma candidum]|uniref:Uncharacterized protein n=1 Tax=Melastoma candidum TaxID=119954 RepID=A0ACB9M4Z0_9MYRT|nr:hypothetical protein MLD38_032218 [Melastoma candidum]
MNLFTEKNVFSGFTTACRFAICPNNLSPFLLYATTDGAVRWPSALVKRVGFPPSIAATAEFVVPKSIPTTFSHVTLRGPTPYRLEGPPRGGKRRKWGALLPREFEEEMD